MMLCRLQHLTNKDLPVLSLDTAPQKTTSAWTPSTTSLFTPATQSVLQQHASFLPDCFDIDRLPRNIVATWTIVVFAPIMEETWNSIGRLRFLNHMVGLGAF